MPTDKRPATYRLSEEARTIVKDWATRRGMSETDVVELAIRLLAKYGVPPSHPNLHIENEPKSEPVPAPAPKPQRKPRKGT
jgi:hypothetical protein